jgi:hypothetical protein
MLQPFTQLFSIQGFVKKGECMKQVPLCYAIMSRRTIEDYASVLTHIKQTMTTYILRDVVLDFEVAMWRAISNVFREVHLRGCEFHWISHKFLKQLLCFNYLPHEHIPGMFQIYRELVLPSHQESLHNFMQYIEDTWVTNSIFTPCKRSVFGHSIHTTMMLKAGTVDSIGLLPDVDKVRMSTI